MIFLGIGSSVGDGAAHFSTVQQKLEAHRIKVVQQSSVLKNPPYGDVAQNEFSNGVWQVEMHDTAWERMNWVLLPESRKQRLRAYKLLKICKAVEKSMGRDMEAGRWTDRVIDLDILMFGDLVLNRSRLTIPHADIANRDFVKEPWKELVDQDFKIPGVGQLHSL